MKFPRFAGSRRPSSGAAWRRHASATLCLLLSANVTAASAVPAELRRPLDFSTHILPNGLKLWHGDMPGARQSTVCMVVHVGRADDPPGAPDLTHLLEHVLLGERNGRELHGQIERLGGIASGSTTPHATFYRVVVPPEHAAFAIAWLTGILTPRPFEPDMIQAERERLYLEGDFPGARFADWLDRVVFPDHDERRSTAALVQKIDAATLEKFHRTHFVPRNMTLVVIGDSRFDEIRAATERAFGGWADQKPPEARSDNYRASPRVRHGWKETSELRYTWTLATRQTGDPLRHIFLAHWLELRLQETLLWSDTRPIYAATVQLRLQPKQSVLTVTSTVTPDRLDEARGIIEREVMRITKTVDGDDQFARDRERLLAAFALRFNTPQSIERGWLLRQEQLVIAHRDFPDPRVIFRELRPADIAAAIGPALEPAHAALVVTRRHPVGLALRVVMGWAVFGAALGLAWFGVRRWARRGALVFPGVIRAGLTTGFLLVVALAAAYAFPYAQRSLGRMTDPHPSYWMYMGGQYVPVAVLGLMGALVLVLLSRIFVAGSAAAPPMRVRESVAVALD